MASLPTGINWGMSTADSAITLINVTYVNWVDLVDRAAIVRPLEEKFVLVGITDQVLNPGGDSAIRKLL